MLTKAIFFLLPFAGSGGGGGGGLAMQFFLALSGIY